jgi:hypothetical protein
MDERATSIDAASVAASNSRVAHANNTIPNNHVYYTHACQLSVSGKFVFTFGQGPRLRAASHRSEDRAPGARLQRVTYDGAARAATSKPVLFRRWPTKAEMVVAAVIDTTTEAIAEPDTGDLPGDLKMLLHAMCENFGPAGRSTMLGMLIGLDHDAAESLCALISGGAPAWSSHLWCVPGRGELDPNEIPARPCWHCLSTCPGTS